MSLPFLWFRLRREGAGNKFAFHFVAKALLLVVFCKPQDTGILWVFFSAEENVSTNSTLIYKQSLQEIRDILFVVSGAIDLRLLSGLFQRDRLTTFDFGHFH